MDRLKRNSIKMGVAGAILCALCCVLPIAGIVLGAGALMAFQLWVEWIGVTLIILSAVFMVLYLVKKRKARSCDLDCNCKSENTVKL